MSRSVRELIALPKVGRRIKSVPKKMGHAQMNLSAVSEDGERFVVFVRVLLDLPESFSIGLVSPAQQAVLVRVNGDHGEHGNEDGDVFDGPHTHNHTDEALSVEPVHGAKPRHAVRILDTQTPALAAYWRMFKGMVALTVSREVDDAISGIYGETAQMAVTFGDHSDHSDHSNDDSGSADGDPSNAT